MHRINHSLSQLQKQIQTAANAAGRKASDITLLGVSKKQSDEKIIAAAQLGLRDFGENYLQEALTHQQTLNEFAINWHFIGPIQSNKARNIAENFSWLHSLDRLKVAERLNHYRPAHLPPLNVCVQINLDNETSKSGVNKEQLDDLCLSLQALRRLKLRGLMLIPEARENYDEQRSIFAQARHCLNKLNDKYNMKLDTLSMGMSADLDAAIAEGATIVRIGSALFGERT